jgi:DNA-binding NtrC family response regulator
MPGNEGNSNKVILVVEDDEQVRKLVSMVLEKAGYMVVTAKDAALALRISRKYRGKINVLVTDVELGCTDGITLAKQITAERPEIGVLLASGNHDYKHRSEFVILTKPFSPQDVLNGVATALKRVETERKHRRSHSNGI